MKLNILGNCNRRALDNKAERNRLLKNENTYHCINEKS